MLDSMAAIGVMDTMQHTASAESTPINDRDRVSRHLQQGDIVVAVLGLTGAGKSTFISELSKDEGIVIGHSLKSCKSHLPMYFKSRLICSQKQPGTLHSMQPTSQAYAYG